MLHQSPRTFGTPTSLWTLSLAAQVCHEKDWTQQRLSGEAIRLALKRLGVSWKRAKHWLTSPDLFAWSGGEPLRLLPNERGGGPQALVCYGLRWADSGAMVLRFVEGRPVSWLTEDFLAWLCERFAAQGKHTFALVWDNAAWHVSKRVRRWMGTPNRRVQHGGGCKIRVCYLPVKAPWLNPIEPKWLPGKRAIVEPDRKRTPVESKQRVHDHYQCPPQEPLQQNAA